MSEDKKITEPKITYQDVVKEEISFARATGYDKEMTSVVPLAELARREEERLRKVSGGKAEKREVEDKTQRVIPVGEIIDVLRAARSVEEVAGVLVEIVANLIPRVLLLWERNNMLYGFASRGAPSYAFNEATSIKQRLRVQGELESAESISGFGRLRAVSPSTTLVVGFFAALVVYLAISAARLRIPSWPLHPVLLLIWGTYPGGRFAASFLVGFVMKWAIVKYGGDKAYRRLKPVVIGLVAGDMLFGLTASTIGGIYYSITGAALPKYSVFW